MTREHLLRRIEALLHHPPERSLTADFDDDAERNAARQHLGMLGMSQGFKSEVDAADRIAAGANEYGFPEQSQPGQQEGAGQFVWREKPILRHPLSGAKVPLRTLLGLDLHSDPTDEVLRKAVNAALQDAPQDGNDADLKQRALWLWRNLPDQLAANDGETPWHLLPADPRIPDHSVWEHLSLTAALATAGLGRKSGDEPGDWQAGEEQPSTASLLLFTLGPVQGFVGAARKTSDLQAGSYLLSYLTWHAIQVVADAFGPEAVLFPDLRRQPLVDRWLTLRGIAPIGAKQESSAATIPNRFFAVVPDGMADDIAKEAEKAVRCEFGRIGSFALGEVKKKIDAPVAARVEWDKYEQQVRDYFECYWAVLSLHRFGEHDPKTFQAAFETEYAGFLDWKDDEVNDILKAFSAHGQQPNVGAVYGRLYRLTEALTGSRKALRNFDSVTEHGYRCSLIPSLPALAPKDPSDPTGTPGTQDMRQFWEHVARHMERGYLAEREQLSAVALAKRFIEGYLKTQGIEHDARFPSTGSFATADFKADVIAVLKGDSLPGKPPPDGRVVVALQAELAKFREKLKPLGILSRDRLTEKALPRLETAASASDNPDAVWLAELDGGWLFTGYDAKQIAKEYGFPETADGSGVFQRDEGSAKFTTAQVDDANQALAAFIGAATDAGIDRPSKYYAVLQMDGDEMGKWLSGQKAPRFGDALHPDFAAEVSSANAGWKALIEGDARRPLTPALHLAISRALGVFSLDLVPRLTEEEHLARRIYSGGDDVLAFVSFRHALPLARRLRAAFSGQVRVRPEGEGQAQIKDGLDDDVPVGHIGVAWSATEGYVKLNGDLLPTMGHTATASTGIVIAHYKQSLQQVFREAHEACEDYAKDHLKRNALAITVLKRSGERFQTGTRWHTTSGEGPDTRVDVDLAVALERYAEMVRDGWIAAGYVYDLGAEEAGLRAFEKPAVDERQFEPLRREAFRLFRRRTEALRNPDVEALPRWLKNFVAATLPDWLAEGDKPDWPGRALAATVLPLLDENPLDRLILLLDAAQFLGQGGDR